MAINNIVPLSHIRCSVSDGVSPSPKGGGAEPAWPPSKSATGIGLCFACARRHNAYLIETTENVPHPIQLGKLVLSCIEF